MNRIIGALQNVSDEYEKLYFVTSDFAQSVQECSASWNSIKNRYNPIVWFFISLMNKN